MSQSEQNIAETIRDIAAAGIVPRDVAGLPVLALAWPKDQKIESLERFLDNPRRKRGKVIVRDHVSFIEYVKRHEQVGTLLLADITQTGGSFKAIIDHHNPTPGSRGEGSADTAKAPTPAECFGLPGWGDHVCEYAAEHTEEWKRWVAISGVNKSQTDLAQFIEDNRMDIASPSGGEVLDLVKSFEASTGVEFKSAVRLDNGDRKINYSHTTVAKAGQQGELVIPDTITLKMPVFVNGPEYEITARFRYSIPNGNLQLRIELVRTHKVIELAMTEARNSIQTELGRKILLGSLAAAK
jgi:uncharacterized protein YfdQ (DUF2303 family)